MAPDALPVACEAAADLRVLAAFFAGAAPFPEALDFAAPVPLVAVLDAAVDLAAPCDFFSPVALAAGRDLVAPPVVLPVAVFVAVVLSAAAVLLAGAAFASGAALSPALPAGAHPDRVGTAIPVSTGAGAGRGSGPSTQRRSALCAAYRRATITASRKILFNTCSTLPV